jgi:hypothetical protein
MKRLAGMMALALSVGCGSSDNSGGSVGSVGGNALTINDAIFAIDSDNIMVLVASDRTGLCSLAQGTTAPTGKTTAFGVGLVNFNGSNLIAHVTGDYTITTSIPTGAGKYAESEFVAANGCTISTDTFATSGTFTLNQVGTNSSGSHATGHFSLKFGADSLNGNVDATYCAALLTSNKIPGCPP